MEQVENLMVWRGKGDKFQKEMPGKKRLHMKNNGRNELQNTHTLRQKPLIHHSAKGYWQLLE